MVEEERGEKKEGGMGIDGVRGLEDEGRGLKGRGYVLTRRSEE